MKELVYRFQNPHNSCEAVYRDPDTGRHYILMPYTPYSQQLCTCTPCRGYYEADCPVSAGRSYLINGHEVITGINGEIIDYAKKEEYENREMTFYKVKTEFRNLPNYQFLGDQRLLPRLYDYMNPEHFDQLTYKRKDVFCLMGFWYLEVTA